MISIDDEQQHPPPDPSSSDSQNQQVISHEALATVSSDIDLLKPKDATTLDHTNYNPHPNFTIRDYVYGSRCKNIACNWPFSRKSLQLCLNYSVKNCLPPFESLDSLRTNQSVSKFGAENNFPDQETVTSFNSKSECHLEEDLAHTKSNSQPTVKKCKLVMKLNKNSEPAAEETVAYKICPVCKIFSSSSNTTLNAHIDQCLSEESCSMKSTSNPKMKTVKQHRIKPRKTRLMVDVYKTAPHCTVEELDRRNGSSWASNSNFPDQELESQAEEKKQEPRFIPKVADHEGAVYIDPNGTKVRILSISKLDNDKGCKFVMGKKKMKACGQKNLQKILKLSPNSKKLSKKAVDYKQTTSGQKENVATLGSGKKDGGENSMKAQANKQLDDNNIVSVTRPPWACSKRTSVVKKRFPVLTKPNKGTPLYDTEDPSIIRSKECKFSSLKKNVLVSASQEQNAAGSKFNLKRKFSALKKPQDSWKQNSRSEKDSEVKKIKKSIASKKSNWNDDSNSSGGVENITTTESDKIEVPIFHSDHNDTEGNNFMDLSNSKFDPGDQGSLDVIIMGHNSTDEKEGNYLEEVEPILLNIPGPPGSFLPPSPGTDAADDHMVISEEEEEEEELQANSSLTTTSRVHSNEDQQLIHHDLMIKTDFISDSPVSTVSSPSFARSSCDKLSSRLIIENNPTSCYQESPLELNRCPNMTINFMPDLFSTVKSSDVDASVKLPDYRDRQYSVVSPTTTPVLRLMGKNLTVVNTDDDDHGLFKPPCSSPMGQLYQGFNLHHPNISRSVSDLRSANYKEIIMIDESSSGSEGSDHHMFTESLIRNREETRYFCPQSRMSSSSTAACYRSS